MRPRNGLRDEMAVCKRCFGAVDAAGRGEDGLGSTCVNALREGGGREPAKDDGVDGAEAVDGEEGDEGGGDHGHVDQHDVALADVAFVAEDGSEGLDLGEERGVGGGLFCRGGDGAVVEDGWGGAVACQDVPVEAVVAGGDEAVREPLPVLVGDGKGGRRGRRRRSRKDLLGFAEDGGRGLVPVEA